ncbi:MAG: DUF533 domain-containing protein [Pseudomonadota bacterium]
MSLKRMAMKMAIAFAAAKGYQAFRQRGGMQGVKQMMSQAGGSGGGLSSMLAGLGGGAAGGGLLGGLAAMAGGTSAVGQGADQEALADAGPQDDETAAIMIRAMGQAVRADGVIDAEERALLDQIVMDAETPEDQAVVDVALSEPVHPEALARDVPRGHEAEVYAAALTAIDPDHPAERQFLKRFATALALDPAEVADLHATARKPAP